jgi:hypothetical protein
MSKQAHQARCLIEQVMREDGTSVSPQYLFDIEVRHVPAHHVRREMAWVLDLDQDAFLASAGAAETPVREYPAACPQRTEAVTKLFRAAQERGFEDWDHLRQGLRTRQ